VDWIHVAENGDQWRSGFECVNCIHVAENGDQWRSGYECGLDSCG
jgi:hypothetical protein